MAVVNCTTTSPFLVGCVGCMDVPEEEEFKTDRASQNYLYQYSITCAYVWAEHFPFGSDKILCQGKLCVYLHFD